MKAHQRIIREKKASEETLDLFPVKPDIVDIKNAITTEIDFATAKKIILEYEWLGTMGTTQRHYGIFFNNMLAGCVCFGYFQSMQGYAAYVGRKYAKQGTQLSRGACVFWAHEHSGSKLIAYGLKREREKGYKFAIAFSDPDAGEIGTLYQATNWHFVGATKDKHWDMYYKNGGLYLNDRDIHKRFGFRGKQKQLDYIADKPHLEIRLRKPKGRYIKLLGDKRENREMMTVLKKHIFSYPKRAEEVSREIRC